MTSSDVVSLRQSYTLPADASLARFRTGTNGAQVAIIAKLRVGNSPAVAAGGEMTVNTDCGALDNGRVMLHGTPFDNKVDRDSSHPHFKAYEKVISGMYLGETTRNILLTLVDAASHPILFGGNGRVRLNMLSLVESVWRGSDGSDGSNADDDAASAALARGGPGEPRARHAPAPEKESGDRAGASWIHTGRGLAARAGARAVGRGTCAAPRSRCSIWSTSTGSRRTASRGAFVGRQVVCDWNR